MIIEFEIENEKYITGIFNDLNGLVGVFLHLNYIQH